MVDDIIKMFYCTFAFIFYGVKRNTLLILYIVKISYGNKRIQIFLIRKKTLLIQVMGSLLWFVKIY